MKKKKAFKKHSLTFFSLISLIIILLFSPYLFFNRPFILVNDQIFQFNLYYNEWTQLIKNFFIDGSLPFYSWHKFLGSDFYSSNALYTIGDIFYPFLVAIFRDVSKALLAESVVMVYISAYSMKYYLSNKKIKSNNIIIAFSILYSISGIATLYYGNYMFHRFYAFMPLLFTGVDLWIEKKSPILFSITTFFLLLQNYYLMFTITAFLPIYFTLTYLKTEEGFIFKDYFKSALTLMFHYIIGFMMSAFLTLPSILNLLGSQRLGNNITDLFWEMRVILGYIISYISGPFPTYTDIPNIFQAGYNGHAYWYSMYASSIIVFILVGSLFSKNLAVKRMAKEYWLISSATLMLLPLNSVFHGFSEPSMRVALPFVFLSIVYTALIIDEDGLKNLYKGLVAYSILFFICISLIVSFGFYEPKHSTHLIYVLVSFFIACLISLASKKIPLYLTLFFLILESTAHSLLAMQTLNKNFYWHNPNFTQEYVDYLHDVDEDLVFRLYVSPNKLMPSSVLNLNQSLQYHFMTTTTYDTMYEPNLSDFLRINGFDWHIINIDNPIIHSLLGVKYYAVTNEDELPNTEFKYVTTLDHYFIYRNPNFSGMGFTYDEYIPLSKVDNSIDWQNQLILSDNDYNRYSSIPSSERAYLKITEKGNNYLIADIDISHETILFVSIPFNKGWSVVDNYDNNLDIMKVQGGFMGLYLQPGNYHLNFNFIPYGFKIGLIASTLGMIMLILTNKKVYIRRTNNNEKEKH